MKKILMLRLKNILLICFIGCIYTDLIIAQEIWIEAECGEKGTKWMQRDDLSASETSALRSGIEGESISFLNSAPLDSQHHLQLELDAPEAGVYSIFGRVKSDQNQNSFWIKANDGNWIKWSNISNVSNAKPNSTVDQQILRKENYFPVIPGATGFGMETSAGRGGKIIKVTNLNGSGPGSLRAAIEAKGPRIVVFEISGIIDLTNRISIKNPNITIAGQTAPSPGIWIKGSLAILTHDVLIQHLTIRCGTDGDYSDPISVGYYGGFPTYNIVLDHISFGWGWDEALEMRPMQDFPGGITFRHVIISHGLNNSVHNKGSHGYGPLIRGKSKISLTGSFIAHHQQRMPLASSDLFMSDNLLYDRGLRFTSLGFGDDSGESSVKEYCITSNFFVDRDSNSTRYAPIQPIHVRNNEKWLMSGSKVYVKDNFSNHSMLKSGTSDWDLVFFNSGNGENVKANTSPIWTTGYKPLYDKESIVNHVYQNAGARPADRHPYDEQLFTDFFKRQGQIVDCVSGCAKNTGGWPNVAQNKRMLTIPTNPNGDDDGDGYTNVEEWLHVFAREVEGIEEKVEPEYTWEQVHDSDNDNAPLKVNLQQGKNTITIATREAGTIIDKIFLTTSNAIPNGLGKDGFCYSIPTNNPPTFNIQRKTTVEEDFTGTVDIAPSIDPVLPEEKDQIINYSLSPLSSDIVNIEFDEKSGKTVLSAKSNKFGSQSFILIADDGQTENNTYQQEFIFSVIPVNDPPKFSLSRNSIQLYSNISRTEFVDINVLTPPFGELEEDITFSLDNLPPKEVATLKIDNEQKAVQINISKGSSGVFDVTIIADDGNDMNNVTTQTLRLEILEPFTPEFSLSGDITIDEDFKDNQTILIEEAFDNIEASYKIEPTSIDFAEISFDSIAKIISISAYPDAFGEQIFSVVATNKLQPTETYEQSFTLTVNPINDPPLFTLSEDQVILDEDNPSATIFLFSMSSVWGEESEEITFSVESYNQDALTLDFDQIANMLKIEPKFGASGIFNLNIRARDDNNSPASSELPLTVIVIGKDQRLSLDKGFEKEVFDAPISWENNYTDFFEYMTGYFIHNEKDDLALDKYQENIENHPNLKNLRDQFFMQNVEIESKVSQRQYTLGKYNLNLAISDVADVKMPNLAKNAQRESINCNSSNISTFDQASSSFENFNIYEEFLFDIIPNPATKQIQLFCKSPNKQVVEIQIFNSFGQLNTVSSEALERGNSSFTLDITSLPEGIYTIILKGSQSQKAKKFVKVR